MVEQGPKSIQELEIRRDKLQNIAVQRSRLDQVIGGQIDGQSIARDLRLARVRDRLAGSISRIDNQAASIDEQITQQSGSLISDALTYKDEVSLLREQVNEARRYAASGHIPQDILIRYEGRLVELESKPSQDEALQRGLDLLKQREPEAAPQTPVPQPRTSKAVPSQPEKREEELPIVIINPDTHEVTIDGKTLKHRGKYGWQNFMLFALNPQKEISGSQVLNNSKQFGSNDNNPGSLVDGTRNVLGDHKDLIKTIVGRGKNTSYKLEARVEFVPSVMIIDENKKLVEFRGKRFQLTDGQFPTFVTLVRNLGEKTLTSRLSASYGEDAPNTRVRNSFNFLARHLNMPGFPPVLTNKMAAKNSWYQLSGVVPVWREIKDKTQRKNTSKKKTVNPESVPAKLDQDAKAPEWKKAPVGKENLSTLNLFLNNPDMTTEQFMSLLLKERIGKQGRKPTLNSTWLNLSRSAQYLILRQEAGIPAEQELASVASLHKLFTEKGFQTIDQFSDYVHDRLFPEGTPVLAEDEIAPDPLLEKSAVLATLFSLNKDLLDALKIDTSYVEDLVWNFKEKMKHKNIRIDDVEDFRANLFGNVENGGSFIDIFENVEDEDVQMLGITLREFLGKASTSVIKSLLNGGQIIWQERHAEILQSWKKRDLEGKTIIVDFQTRPLIEPKTIVNEHSEEDTNGEPKIVPLPTSNYETPATIAYVSAMERRDPDVRAKVKNIATEVTEKIKSEPASLRQVSREFNNLPRKEINLFMNKRTVGARERDSSPEFTRAEVALMLYIKRNGNGLNSREVRDLKGIISEEMAKQKSSTAK